MMDLLVITKTGAHHFGHPVIAAACLATLQEITETNLMEEAMKGNPFKSLLVHPLIEEVRGKD
jgi:4-aminobutyrate aminotransferase-like enzyme